MKEVIEYTSKKYVMHLTSNDKIKAIKELAKIFENTDICSDINSLTNALIEREDIMSTGIGLGIAVPHAKISSVNKMAFAIGISKKGIDFDSIDGQPVNLIILVAAGEKQHKKYLRLLSNIMSILKNVDLKDKIINSETADEVIKIFDKAK